MSFGGGGGTTGAYKSPNIPEYEKETADYFRNRAGIKKKMSPEYLAYVGGRVKNTMGGGGTRGGGGSGFRAGSNAGVRDPMAGYRSGPQAYGNPDAVQTGGYRSGQGTQEKIPEMYTYDTSEAGKPVTREDAIAPYSGDLALMDKANRGFESGAKFKQQYDPYKLTQTYQSAYNPEKYNAAQFDYQGLPEQYGTMAKALGSKDIQRQGQGDLQAIQEAAGTRRPGLLMKAGQKNQRDVAEQLAAMRGQIDLEQMRQKTDLGVKQQADQAAENMRAAQFGEGQAQFGAGEGYRGYQSRADLEKALADQSHLGYESRSSLERAQADEDFRNKQALSSGAQTKIATEASLQQQQQSQEDAIMDYLTKLYLGTAEAGKGTKGSWNVGLG